MIYRNTANSSAIQPLPRLVPEEALYAWDQKEIAALEKIAKEIVEAICEKARASSDGPPTGDIFCKRVRPVFENFGAFAQVRIMQRIRADRLSPDTRVTLLDEGEMRELLGAAIQKGRDGCRPQLIPFRLKLDKMQVRGELLLFVGIRP